MLVDDDTNLATATVAELRDKLKRIREWLKTPEGQRAQRKEKADDRRRRKRQRESARRAVIRAGVACRAAKRQVTNSETPPSRQSIGDCSLSPSSGARKARPAV